eukprot:1606456-Amphidinium_carterae.1
MCLGSSEHPWSRVAVVFGFSSPSSGLIGTTRGSFACAHPTFSDSPRVPSPDLQVVASIARRYLQREGASGRRRSASLQAHSCTGDNMSTF